MTFQGQKEGQCCLSERNGNWYMMKLKRVRDQVIWGHIAVGKELGLF